MNNRDTIIVIPFTNDTKEYIKQLNYEWLQKYFSVEPSDAQQLTNPQEEIIDKGGHIFYAQLNNNIVGTVTLMRINNDTYELAKMAVTESAQGKGIGKILMDFIINKAVELQCKRLILYTNSILVHAIQLYKTYGFVPAPLNENHYIRADTKMTLELS
jgi:N-acetylglutamate synthase-like GNAT family acetyltransferase